MMMNVGLEISDASMPRPIATPRARTVFPVPSSPERAKTSFGRAARPRRSPSRSVCKEEWLTRSSDARSFFRSATGDLASEFAALEEESNGDAEERAEECRPDREPPFLRDLTQKLHAHAAAERAAERDEAESADERPAPAKRFLIRFEARSSLVVRALLPPVGFDKSLSVLLIDPIRRTMLSRIAPVAAPSTSCHERRLALTGPPPRQGPLPLGPRSLALGESSSSVCAGSSRSPPLSSASARSAGTYAAGPSPLAATSGEGVALRPMLALLKTNSRAEAVWIAARAPASAANGSYTAGGRPADPKPMRQRTVGRSSRVGDPDAVTASP